MALSEYMPYGAPELLADAPARMARSTMLASLAVVISVALLGGVFARGATSEPDVPALMPVIDLFDLLPPQSPPTVPPQVEPAHPSASYDANRTPVLKPDELVPPGDLSRIEPQSGPVGEGPIAGPVASAATPGTGPAADPLPNEFVYTDQMPVLALAIKPRYPDLAREAGVEGTVSVQILVGLDGRVLRAIIAPGGSVPMLDDAALEAARATVFTPALANGHPVKVWVRQQYRFRLH